MWRSIAQTDGGEVLFLGDDFLPWMVLALGAALVAGNVMALVRPPRRDGRVATASEGPAERPPLLRTGVMIAVGLVASVWGIASLVG